MAKAVDVNTLVGMYGGHFRLTSIIQKRLKELVKGARPLVDVPRGRKDMTDIVLRELSEGRIEPTEEVAEPPAREELFKPAIEDEE